MHVKHIAHSQTFHGRVGQKKHSIPRWDWKLALHYINQLSGLEECSDGRFTVGMLKKFFL